MELTGSHEKFHILKRQIRDSLLWLVLFLHFLEAIQKLRVFKLFIGEIYQIIYEQRSELKYLL